MSRYDVTIGKDFQIAAMDVPSAGMIKAVSQAAEQAADSRTRRTLAYSILGATAVALAAAAVSDHFGNHGTWYATIAVWSATGPLCGGVLAHYFGRRR